MAILLKRTREPALPEDGARVLVERRRPRGIGEEDLSLSTWLPVLAPSDPLRRWFAARPLQWPLFRRRYLAELGSDEASVGLSELHAIAESEDTLTLLSSTLQQERSHAAILRDLLEGVRKPPSTSGPVRAASSGRVRARRKH
jgi:uncharacterized protein YeaO (DUF488 family)